MDIQKEREAFEAYMAEKYKNLMDKRYLTKDVNAWEKQCFGKKAVL